jgi:hypothetical protein
VKVLFYRPDEGGDRLRGRRSVVAMRINGVCFYSGEERMRRGASYLEGNGSATLGSCEGSGRRCAAEIV